MITLFRQLHPFFYQYRWYLIWGSIFIVISNLFSIYPAQVVRYAFDLVADLIQFHGYLNGFDSQSVIYQLLYNSLGLYGIIVFGMAVIRGVFLFFVRQTLIVMSRKIEYEQKKELYHTYQQYSLSLIRKRQTGDLMARISEDVGNVRMFTGPGIMYTFNTIILFFMILVTMLMVNVELTFYVLLPLPFLSLSIFLVHRIIIKRSDALQQQLSKITSIAQETFSGIRLIKAFGREEHFGARYAQESINHKQLALNLVKVDALFYPLISMLIGLSIIAIVWIGGEKVIGGSVTVGNIAEFMIYVNLLIWPVAALGWVTSLTQKAVASQARIQEMLNLRSEITYPLDSPAVQNPSLELKEVSFVYPDTGIIALERVSFAIQPGQFIGIVGATGCGKTTLAHLLNRLYDPTDGIIYLDNRPISTYTKSALANTISYVPQDLFLFSDTIFNNIAFGNQSLAEEQVIAAAQFAGVYDDIMDFPNQFQTVIGERGVTLSGGQKQRIGIARAYLLKTPILIMDDSLSAVDAKTEEHILHNLSQPYPNQTKKPTIILITHRLSALYQADHIFVLESGKLIESGSFQQLLEQGAVFKQMYDRQLLEQEMGPLVD